MFAKKTYVRPERVSLGKPAPMRINMLFVGSSGTAKKTLLRRLAESYDVEITWKASHGNNTADGSSNHQPPPGLRIEEVCCFYYESHAGDCDFHFYDYVKFGDLINNECCSSFLRTYLLEAHEKWINLNVNKYTDKERNLKDERIHVLFTIFTPHALLALLLETVQSVCGLAPIVPVVSKADSMTWEERENFLIELHQALKGIARSLNRTAIVDFKEQGEFIDCEEGVGRGIDDTATNLQTSNPALLCTIVETHQSTNVELASSVASVEQHADVMGGESALLVDFPSPHPLTAEDADAEEKDNTSVCSSEKSCVEEVAYTVASHCGTSTMSHTESHRSTALPKVRNIFAVICSDSRSSQRCYPWGSVNSLDENYSDFRRLQRLIFESGNLTYLRGLCQEMSMGLSHPSEEEDTGKESEAANVGEANHSRFPSSIPSTTIKVANTRAKALVYQSKRQDACMLWIRRVLTFIFIQGLMFGLLSILRSLHRFIFESGILTYLRGLCLCQGMSMGLSHPSEEDTGKESEAANVGEANHSRFPSSIPSATIKVANTRAKALLYQSKRQDACMLWTRRVLTFIFIQGFTFWLLSILLSHDSTALLCFFVIPCISILSYYVLTSCAL